MKVGFTVLAGLGALFVARPATAEILDYVYTAAGTGTSPQVVTFSVDTTKLSPAGSNAVGTTVQPFTGTVDGSATVSQNLYFPTAASVLLGGFVEGASTTDANAIRFAGPQLFTGTSLAPVLSTGVFNLYSYTGGQSSMTTPVGTLSVFQPIVYDFDFKGVSFGTPFDLNFEVTSTPESYTSTGDFGPAFTVGDVTVSINGVSRALSSITFSQDGEIFVAGSYFGQGGALIPGNFEGDPFFSGPLYDAAFIPGTYAETSYASGSSVPYAMTITEVSAVPEPASWALMTVGLGLLAALARRRSMW